MPIREVWRSGERNNPRGRRKKSKKARAERLGAGLKHKLDSVDLGANNHGTRLGTKLAAMSAFTPSTWPRPRRQNLWRRDMLARHHQQWRRAKGPNFEIIPLGAYLWFFFKKGLKNKKLCSYFTLYEINWWLSHWKINPNLNMLRF